MDGVRIYFEDLGGSGPTVVVVYSGRLSTHIVEDLALWCVSCLIYMGELDEAFDDAKRAAGQIPGARFLAFPGLDHVTGQG